MTFTMQRHRENLTGSDKPGDGNAALGAIDDHVAIHRESLGSHHDSVVIDSGDKAHDALVPVGGGCSPGSNRDDIAMLILF